MNRNKQFSTHILSILFAMILILVNVPNYVFAEETQPVASLTIGSTTTEYATFEEAIEAANKASGNRTIKLLRNVDATNVDRLFYTGQNGTLTIDFGQYTLTCNQIQSGNYSTMKFNGTTGGVNGTIWPNAGLTIDGGVYKGTIHLPFHCSDLVINGGTFTSSGRMLTQDGGKVRIKGGDFTSESGFLVNSDTPIPDMEIYGGTFRLTNDSNVMFTDAGGRIDFYGGTYENGLKVEGEDLEGMLAYDKAYWIDEIPQSIVSGQAEITGGDVEVKEAPIASVTNSDDTKYYRTLHDALTRFNAVGGTMTILKNISHTLSDGEVLMELTGSGTLDLNGHTLKTKGGSAVIYVTSTKGDIAIQDSSEEQTGAISGSSYSVWHNGQYNVTIKSGTYVNVGRMHTGSFIIDGGTFTFTHPLYDNSSAEEGRMSLCGGTFEQGIIIQGPTPTTTTVSNILGTETHTYLIGDEIWARSRVNALGTVQEFEKGKCVRVVKEEDAVANFTYNEPGQNTKVTYYTSLLAAIAKEKEGADSDDYVTLLKNTDENITIDNDIHMVFKGKANGVFTFKGEGNAIYLEKNIPNGMKLNVKCDSYSTELNTNNVIIWNSGDGVQINVNDVVPVDKGVKAKKTEAAIGLVHEHEWGYTLAEENGTQTISAICRYPLSCTLSEGTEVASVVLENENVTYDNTQKNCTLSRAIYSNEYTDAVPNDEDVIYYDVDGNPMSEKPVNAGTYTAKITFGDKTAVAKLVIMPASLAADSFAFIPPENTVYDGSEHTAQVSFVEGIEGAGNITVKYNGSENPPTDAGTYEVSVDVTEGANYGAAVGIKDRNWTFKIAKADQAAPEVTKIDESIFGKNDGMITDVTDKMEYRKDGEDTYSLVTGTKVSNLSVGQYFVRYKEDSNHNPSPETPVTIDAGRKLTVTVPQNQTGYTMTVDTVSFDYNGGFKIMLDVAEGYSKTSDFVVKFNDKDVHWGDGTQKEVQGLTEDILITVEGIADVTAPLAEIQMNEDKWTTFWNGLTSGLLFNETQNVTITATDNGSGVNTIQYYLADREHTITEVEAITEWESYNGTFSIDPDNKYIIYARITDNAGNVAYVNSNGIILDKTTAVIEGIENGETYYGDTTFSVSDTLAGVKEVKVDGNVVTLTNGEYTIPADDVKHVITVTDYSNNVVEYTIRVNRKVVDCESPKEEEKIETPKEEEKQALPDTGDDSNLWLWLALLFVSGAGICCRIWRY